LCSAGTLYLSEFSGPVEGILLICGVYFITGLLPCPPTFCQGGTPELTPFALRLSGVYGPSFWDQKVLHLAHLDRIPFLVKYVPDLGINDSFMVFGAFSLAANIVNSYVPIPPSFLSRFS
jgi:ethanolaminephosphotransferase